MGFIFNVDDSKKIGSHWLAVFVDDKSRGYYFDSYGLPPLVPNIAHTLRKNCKTFQFNDRQLQSDFSSVCGDFCLMFLYYMCFGIELQTFFDQFSENLRSNDDIAREFVEKLRQRKSLGKNINASVLVGDGQRNFSIFSQSCSAKQSRL